MTPSSVTAVYSDAYVSTFDIHKPSIRNVLFRKYGNQGYGFFHVLDTLGYREAVDQTTYSHFEEDWIHQTFSSRNAVGSPGAGNPISITLSAGDLDSSNRFFVQVNDNVMFNNQVTGIVTAISVAVPSAPVLTIYPNQTTDNIGAVAAGDTMIIYSDSWAEGTAQPAGHVNIPIKYNFNCKITKVTNEATGSEMTNRIWVDYMSDGQKLGAWYWKGQIDADYEMAARIDGALLFDRPTTNAALVALEQRTTFGLVPWIRSGGNTDTYTPGFYSIADFDATNETLDANFAPSEMLELLGISANIEISNLFTNSFDAGSIVYASFKEGQKSADLAIDFSSFSKNGRTWHFKRMDSFNHPKFYGAPGFNFRNMMVMTPMDKQRDADPSGKGNMIPSIGMRYKSLGDYNRQMKVWKTGGAQASTNQTDKDEMNQRTEFGSEYIASNRFFLTEAL